ncbi:hypothetical protein [Psychroserpens sp. BH13MA-6]
MIKITYSKDRLNSNYKMGIIFIALGMVLVFLSFSISERNELPLFSIGIGQIAAGIFMFVRYYTKHRTQYLTLKNGELTKNTLFPKTINLAEIISIKEFAGNLKLRTEKTELTIDTQIIEQRSLIALKTELNNYGGNKNWIQE